MVVQGRHQAHQVPRTAAQGASMHCVRANESAQGEARRFWRRRGPSTNHLCCDESETPLLPVVSKHSASNHTATCTPPPIHPSHAHPSPARTTPPGRARRRAFARPFVPPDWTSSAAAKRPAAAATTSSSHHTLCANHSRHLHNVANKDETCAFAASMSVSFPWVRPGLLPLAWLRHKERPHHQPLPSPHTGPRGTHHLTTHAPALGPVSPRYWLLCWTSRHTTTSTCLLPFRGLIALFGRCAVAPLPCPPHTPINRHSFSLLPSPLSTPSFPTQQPKTKTKNQLSRQ